MNDDEKFIENNTNTNNERITAEFNKKRESKVSDLIKSYYYDKCQSMKISNPSNANSFQNNKFSIESNTKITFNNNKGYKNKNMIF